MDYAFSFKDFEKVQLKSTYNMEIGNRKIVPGETLAYFDKIQIIGLSERNEHVSARGGYGNRERVFWNTLQEMPLQFAQGVFSKEQFAMLLNSRIIAPDTNRVDIVSEYEVLEVDENLQITLSRENIQAGTLFIYEKDTGKSITDYTIEGSVIQFGSSVIAFTEMICTYEWGYTSGSTIINIGQELLKGYISLEGRTRIKDDTVGTVTTGIIKIPKLKLMSDVSIRLGADASPLVANFSGTAIPVGSRGNQYAVEFYCLDSYLDGDI